MGLFQEDCDEYLNMGSMVRSRLLIIIVKQKSDSQGSTDILESKEETNRMVLILSPSGIKSQLPGH